ncbi:hypothetical protein [Desulfonema magnum]|uniref:Uncharacterized protein n=1 Tax=Desulfonema magnum TaxID=45655 RepID=A0A975BKM5_9BACT|nr:hypothetical protein [Desulfonema magnum]QTA86868.1 Uncharacterized protein dnm_028930 [Desulfonema magnum]
MHPLHISGLTLDELRRRRLKSLIMSEKAIREYPGEYHQIKNQLNYILTHLVDVSEYFSMACSLAAVLKKMGKGTLFYEYYYENLHPNKFGRARYFRATCGDLLEQINELKKWRSSKHKLTLIK